MTAPSKNETRICIVHLPFEDLSLLAFRTVHARNNTAALCAFAPLREQFLKYSRDRIVRVSKNATPVINVKNHKKLKDSAVSFVHRMLGVDLILIKYGLAAGVLAAKIESDVMPVLAGLAASHGCFNPVFAIAATSFGALAGDCLWFYVGR